MKKTITKIYYGAVVILLILGASRSASGQTYTNSKLAINAWATAICNDASGNIYAVESANKTGVSDYGKVVKYATNGTVTTLYTGNTSTLPFNDCDGSAQTAIGIAVTSNGDVYVTTNYDFGATNCASTYGAIIKLTAASSYAESPFLAGSVTFGGFTALAVDQSDNLYALVYDQTGNSGSGSYEVEEFPSSGGKGTAPVAGSKFRINNSDACKLYVNALNSYSAPENETALTVDPSGNIYVADAFDGGSHSITGTTYKLTKGSGNSYTKSTFLNNVNVMALGSDANGNIYATYNTGFNATTLIEYVGGSTTTTHTIATGLDYTDEFELNSIAAINETDLYINDGEQSSSDNDGIEQFFGAPTTQASGVSFSSTTEKTTNITWTNGNGTNRAVFMAQSTAGSISFSNGTLYNASTTFGSGTSAGTGWSCVYNSATSTLPLNISNLAANTGYKVMVVEYNGGTGAQDYDTGTGTNNPNTFTTPANPSLTASGGTDSYSIGGTAAVVDAGITATAGQTNLNTATITVSTNFVAGDALNFTNQNGITGSFTGSTLTLSGSSSVANYQTALRSITFTSTSSTASTRTISFLVGDGTANSSTVTKQVTVTSSTTISSLTAVTSTTTNAASVQYTATFAASISGLSTADFTLNTTGVSGASVASVSGSGTSWTVTVNTGSGNGTVQLAMNSSSGVTPSVSNATSGSPFTGTTYTIDKTAPTASSITATTPSNATTTNASSVIYTVTFSESVTGVDASDFALTTSGTSGTVSGVSGSGTTYAVTVSSITGTGTLRLDLNSSGTGITDAAGNAISGGFTTGSVYTIDRTAPTVSSITLADNNPTNATTVDYTVTFSEPVTGVTSGAFGLVTTSGNAAGTINSVTPVSTSVYTVNVTGVSGNGGLRLDLTNVSSVFDLNGNQLASGFTGSIYTIDNTPATLTSGSYFSNNGFSSQYAKVGDVLTLSVGYNEQLQSATMTIGGNTVPVSFSNNNQNFTGTYTMTSSDTEGNVGWTLSATDLAGNVRNYTNNDFGTVLIFDKTPPAISISSPSQANANAAATVNYTVSYSDANFNFSSLGTGDITLNTTGTATGTLALSGSGTSYTVTISNITGDGTIGFSIGAGTAQDIPGNVALASSASGTFTADNTAPLANTLVYKSNNANQLIAAPGNVVSLSFTTSEAIQPPTVTIGGNAIAATNTGGNDWVASYTVTGSDPVGRIHFSTTITDLAGNSTPYDDVDAGDDVEVVSNNASLSNLTLAVGYVKHPNFVSTTFNYASFVGAAISSDTFTPTSTDGNATITVNGQPVTSGSPSQPITLNFGQNLVTIVVTAQDGSTTQTYTDTLYRALSTNSNLLTLKTNHGPLSPTFSNTTLAYTLAVGYGVSSITFTGTTVDPNATMTVGGSATASATESAPQSLNVGDNVIDVVVTAQDGSSKTFETTVTRAPSSNSNLLTLVTNHGVLTPGFNNSTLSYTKAVNSGVTSITFTATTADANATLTVGGGQASSGTASMPQPLIIGDNVIDVVVTAQDGSSKTFAVTVTRAKSSNDKLYTIVSNRGGLTQTSPGATTYTKNVNYPFSTINFTVTSVDPNATITVGGSPTASGTPSVDQPLNVGDNPIAVVITAQDGVTSQTYTVTVTRAAQPLNSGYVPVAVSNPTNNLEFLGDGIKVHEGLSPNGDGMNDFLMIEGINNHPDNRLQIMNRSGQLIFEAKGYDNSTKVFDGHSNKNGQMQLPGTYFYSLDYTDKGETKHKTGFIVLKY